MTDNPMQLGMVGLGRMGSNIVRRLMADGHRCVGYDVSADAVAALEADGAGGATTVEEFVAKLERPRAVWVMVPAGDITDKTITMLADALDSGDVIIDGGNTHYHDDIRHANALREKGIHHVDCGTSGGVWGLERGYCLMIGGEDEVVQRLSPIFASVAPGVDSAPRTPGRTGEPTQAEQGYLHCGPNGAGHFVKMVHNGIEYGLMAAYAEGLNIIKNADVGKRTREADAETSPLRAARVLPVRDRHHRGRRGVAARQRGRVVAARSHRAGPVRVAHAGGVRRAGVRLGRGPMDVDRGHRGRHPVAGADHRPVLAVCLARGRRLRRQGAVGDAQAVRRSRREAGVSVGPAIEVQADPAAVARRAADFVAGKARAAVADHGQFSFAVSGGHTPWAMFAELADEEMPWAQCVFYQVDERVAPAGDPDRNLTHLLDSLPAEADGGVRADAGRARARHRSGGSRVRARACRRGST